MPTKKNLIFIPLMFVSFFYIACTDKLQAPMDCENVRITFDEHIEDILDRNCSFSGCHDNQNQASFSPYFSLDDARKNAIVYNVLNGLMPEDGNIPYTDVDTIRCWQENGFLEN